MKNPKPKLLLDWATHEAAKYACKHWHYSKSLPSGKAVKIGAWENGKFIGVVMYGLGATPNLSKKYNLTMQQCCELTRIAFTNHQSPITKIMSVAQKMLKRSNPGLRLIVSFADTAQGHHGGIYQGANWVYSGAVVLDHWVIKGQKKHPRSVVAQYGSQAAATVLKIDPKAKKIWGTKHRYLMPLDAEMRKRILPLSQPYPKRAESKANVAPVHQTGEGGVTPTSALQNPVREDGVKWSEING